ncbi:uncharacterized protein C05D11.1-like [Centruroides sculpturatus]|uniref:uncharacterized protein C05D11.1-like n=1 Tax=Centruroides sculpturatus TaxID=218467 RepID=UPI000C6E5039|nr:uncharacterized protein C05D11.1-like [Centruroides sculpturatus]
MSEVNDDYQILYQLKYEGEIPVTKYQSKKTGLKICIFEMERPIVSGFFTFATETHDDDGLPHTLEHLTFMGSELYPFKGILDQLANRCLSSGAYAYTAIDHTTYIVNTIGPEGFLNLLPIYMDHLLYPLLTDEAFVTEIHHINGEGKDAGVLYCEMEYYENCSGNQCYREMYKEVYPGKCGYKSEEGGRLKNLRESTTNEKVKEYHRQFYRIENLCITITGKLNVSDVFKALSPIEEKIIQKGRLPEFIRPWQSPIPPLTKPVVKTVPYLCDNSENGIIEIAWRGPLLNEIEECEAVELLLDYLDETSASPLQREFVQIEEPYCSDVYSYLLSYSETLLIMHFDCVSKAQLNNIKSKLLEILTKLATGEEEFDMKRISTMLHNLKLNTLNNIEKKCCYRFAHIVTVDFLYGKSTDELEKKMQSIHLYNELEKKDMKYWQNLLKKYLLVENNVTIIGEPRPELKEKSMKDEELRISKQKEILGEEGLKAKEELLQAAKKKNDIKPPKELLQSIPIPSFDKVEFQSIRRLTNCKEDPTFDQMLQEMPCSFHLDDVNTKFVTMWMIMDTASIPLKLRYYLPLFLKLIMELPVERNGKLIPYEEVVTELNADILEKSYIIGIIGCSVYDPRLFAQLITLYFKVEEEKYQKGIQWIHELLYKTKFTADRIQVYVKRMLKRITRCKELGFCVMRCLESNIMFKEDSNQACCSMLKQNTFLKKVQKLLELNPDEVINDLEELRSKLIQPDNILVHMTANLNSLGENSLSHWKNLMESPAIKPFLRHKIMDPSEYLFPLPTQSCITAVGSADSSFLIQATRCINSCKHPDYPALSVLLKYLNQAEGPLWRIIRGLGRSYYFGITLHVDYGLITFDLYHCAAMVTAFKETKKYIDDLLNGKEEWDQLLLESSRSSLVYDIIARNEESVQNIAFRSLICYYRDTDLDFTRKTLLNQIFKINIEDLQSVATKYLLPLFDPTTSSCGICCCSSKIEEIVSGFKEMDRNLNVIDNLDDCLFSQIQDESSSKEY